MEKLKRACKVRYSKCFLNKDNIFGIYTVFSMLLTSQNEDTGAIISSLQLISIKSVYCQIRTY